MAIFIKNNEQIAKMRKAGAIVAKTLGVLEGMIREGVTTGALNDAADAYIRSQNAFPSFLNYDGFPKSVCVSINDQVIHGIPGIRRLKTGDIVSIDIGACFEGFHGDAARTFIVGETSEDNARLVKAAEESFFGGIKLARQGTYLHEISAEIAFHLEKYGFSAVRDYVGHGIGKKVHEAPQIPNYRMNTRGPRLAKGMTLAIEPMVNAGTHEVIRLADGWTVVTKDKKFSAHYENTILVTDGEPEILTIL